MNPTPHQPGLVSLVIPAKNEEAAIEATLRRLPLATLRTAGFAVEVVVLDGHSLDGTAAIAGRCGARVIPDKGRGKGTALRGARDQLRGDYVVMLDADGTYAPDAIPRLLAPLAWGEADVAIGDRVPVPGAMSGAHRVGNRLLSLAARTLYARSCPDLCTGMWAFRADALRRLPLRSRGFGLEAELFALCSRLRLRIAHVRVDYLPRQGEAKLRSGPDGTRIALRLLKARFMSLDGARRAGSPQPAPTPAPPALPTLPAAGPATPTTRATPAMPLPATVGGLSGGLPLSTSVVSELPEAGVQA